MLGIKCAYEFNMVEIDYDEDSNKYSNKYENLWSCFTFCEEAKSLHATARQTKTGGQMNKKSLIRNSFAASGKPHAGGLGRLNNSLFNI